MTAPTLAPDVLAQMPWHARERYQRAQARQARVVTAATPRDDLPQWLTVNQAAAWLEVNARAVYRLPAEVERRRIGGRIWLRSGSLLAHLDARAAARRAKPMARPGTVRAERIERAAQRQLERDQAATERALSVLLSALRWCQDWSTIVASARRLHAMSLDDDLAAAVERLIRDADAMHSTRPAAPTGTEANQPAGAGTDTTPRKD